MLFTIWLYILCFINGFLLGKTIIDIWFKDFDIYVLLSLFLELSLFFVLPHVLWIIK